MEFKEKACIKCGITKVEEDFSWRGKNRTTRRNECKKCTGKRIREYYLINDEAKKKEMTNKRDYYHNNKEHLKAKARERRLADPDKAKESWLKCQFGITMDIIY